MKKIFIFLAILFIGNQCFSQDKKSEDSLSFNMLKAPSTPAFVLMGLETSNIEKPTEITDFAVIINNATNGLTTLPKNFAMQFAPISLFKKNKYTFNEITSNNLKDNFNQSLLLSIGFSKSDSVKKKNDQLGVGLKFSLLRGKLDDEFHKQLNLRMNISKEGLKLLSDSLTNDVEILTWNGKKANFGIDTIKNKEEIDSLSKLIENKTSKYLVKAKEYQKKLREKNGSYKKLSEISFKRYGWKADISAGWVYDILNQKVDSSKVTKTGIWLNLGYETPTDFSILSVVRYMNEYDLKTAKNTTDFDLGLRLLQGGLVGDKLSLSFEYIWRSRLGVETRQTKNTNRYVFNAEYILAKNQLLGLSLGKNFDDSNIKDGNLIAALNFIVGFGAKR